MISVKVIQSEFLIDLSTEEQKLQTGGEFFSSYSFDSGSLGFGGGYDGGYGSFDFGSLNFGGGYGRGYGSFDFSSLNLSGGYSGY
ncbi:hypothetical protein WKK05_13905 [Nostoc sp. UHCC 0302]|uniref:hypothetical protein n=1 Tax=Nostoc sp. UHCC 0302 TaxID=3134896 RepID=UPI00311CC7B6